MYIYMYVQMKQLYTQMFTISGHSRGARTTAGAAYNCGDDNDDGGYNSDS